MPIALFIPCYVDQLKPEVGLAAVEVLETLGFQTVFPLGQTCCGQPFLSAGEVGRAQSLFQHYLDVFEEFDEIIALSGSCAATIRGQLPRHIPGSRAEQVAGRTREFSEFLVEHDVAQRSLGAFPFRVGLHASCHALRELRHGTPSESREPARVDPARALLSRVDGLELVTLTRPDECCGFGGLFSVEEEAVSCRMGLDRVKDHRAAGAEVIVSTDVSCLLQLEGIAKRNEFAFRTLHLAEVLAASLTATTAPTKTNQPDNLLHREDRVSHGPR